MIVDSPGIGDSKRVNEITLRYLRRAYAFIYVINSINAGGVQEDRVSFFFTKCIVFTRKSAVGINKVFDQLMCRLVRAAITKKLHNLLFFFVLFKIRLFLKIQFNSHTINKNATITIKSVEIVDLELFTFSLESVCQE